MLYCSAVVWFEQGWNEVAWFEQAVNIAFLSCMANRPFSYSKKECGSNDISSHFVEFSNVYNNDRSSNATKSNLVYKNV